MLHRIETGTADIDGLDVAYLAMGVGPLALCLHGFPDTAHTYRYLLPALADAGYRAVASFQRGYAPTSPAPDGVYQVGALAHDANGLHEVLGGDADSVIVGHDWGAVAAYGAAGSAPERWSRVVGMAVPPGPALGEAMVGDLDQLQRSWYMFFLLHPLADVLVPANNFAFVRRIWDQWSPGYDASVDLANVVESLSEAEQLLGAIGYYRALLGTGARDSRYDGAGAASQVLPSQPTLYLHGVDDGCVGVDVVDRAAATYPAHVRVETIADAGHFLHLEAPDLVADLITSFLDT